MSVTLHLNPELEAGLAAKARASGMELEEYLLTVVEKAGAPGGEVARHPDQEAREQAVRQMLHFGEKYRLDLGEPVSRRLLHEGHRF